MPYSTLPIVSVGDDIDPANWGNVVRSNFEWFHGIKQRSASKTVAASDSSQADKDAADYLCDGTSDEDEINAAIAALGAIGGSVMLAAGTYTVDGTITIPSNVALMGQGYSTVIKVDAAQATNLEVIKNSVQTGAGNVNIILQDLIIDGNKANVSASVIVHGAYIKLVTQMSMVRVTFRNFKGGDGCRIETCSYYVLHQCDFRFNDVYGLNLFGINNFRGYVNGCQAFDNTDGFRVTDGRQIIFNGCIAEENGFYGFYLSEGDQHQLLGCQTTENGDGNVLNLDYAGISLYACRDCVISNCSCYFDSNNGIHLQGTSVGSALSRRCTVIGCTIYLCGMHAVYVSNAEECRIESNNCYANGTLSNNTFPQIYLNNQANYCLVSGNNCKHNTAATNKPSYGISCHASNTGNYMVHNDARNGGNVGAVNAGAATTTLSGNRT